jgi:hypothetical protein
VVDFGTDGRRRRDFRVSVREMQEVDFDDFPFEPRTCGDYMEAVSQVAECCGAQHDSWVVNAKIPDGDRAIYEDDILSKVLDYAVKYDALNIKNLACMEIIVRRKQLIAEAHVHNPGAPSYDAADHFMGFGYRPGGAIVVPKLSKRVSELMAADTAILKEKRKVQEARGRGGGGGGRGKAPKGGTKIPTGAQEQ